MTDKFILWAQALDNASPDHFDVHGKDVEPDDTIQRQEAVSKVSSVIKNGARLFEQKGVLLTANASHFVVEVPSAQHDYAGRTAPIVCYGDYGTTVGDELGSAVAVALNAFAKKIGRTLQPIDSELARMSFEALKKKSLMTKRVLNVGIGVAGLVIFVIIFWLV
ncbi:hypothetical protein [Alcaligenes faecalis]|uniref:Uncharacterized protein n=1 Tax=Alcaligenes faecalis TaxID=511 RepID=A0AAE9KMS0_ALCFA|nr:hypothetical protein [Alcaligenes faecalis]UPL20479.1 hypothetical protein MXF72_13805 [Alcaligenes faecalis]